MDKIKNFFQKKKLDAKFKVAGQGRRLDTPQAAGASHNQTARGAMQKPQQSRSSTDAQVRAAEAALQRVNMTQENKPSRSAQAIRAQAKRLLEAEQGATAAPAEPYYQVQDEREFEAPPVLAVNGVFFSCELLSEDLVLPRDMMVQQVEELLREQLSDEPVVASSIMIHSLNPMRERRQEAIDIIAKYMDNLMTYPDQPKYRKIRTTNKVFAEKVASLKGTQEFLEAIGFQLITEGEEQFFMFPEERANDLGALVQAKEILTEGEPVPLKLYRNASILRPSAVSLGELSLPSEFFDRSASEIKHEQKERADELDKLMMLRTREMRERDEIKRVFRYRYTLIRIRFPDGYMLQGTFSSGERFAAIEEFVHQYLCVDWASFVLKDPRGETLTPGRTHDRSLAELQLAAASVLHFEWDAEVAKDAAAAGQDPPTGYLKPELLEEAQEM